MTRLPTAASRRRASAPHRLRKVLLAMRAYPIRVESPIGQTSGPMSQEMTYEQVAARSGIAVEELRVTEKGSVSHKQRRIGEFDWRYSGGRPS